MDIFKGQNLLEFSDRFKSDEDCKEYLAGIKWKDGFGCLKCGHRKSQVRKDFSRTCNICSHQESATANTLFLSLIHISEPTRRTPISYAVFCLKTNQQHHQLPQP